MESKTSWKPIGMNVQYQADNSGQITTANAGTTQNTSAKSFNVCFTTTKEKC